MGRVDLAGLLFNLLEHLITKLFGQYEFLLILNFYAFSFNQLLQRKEIWPNCSKLGFANYLNVEQIWAEASTQMTKKCNFNVEQTVVSAWSEKWQISW